VWRRYAGGAQKDHTATLEACRAAHVIVLTYAVNKPASLAYLRTNLLPSLRMAHVAVPMILVGCMQDTVAQQPQSLESEIGASHLPPPHALSFEGLASSGAAQFHPGVLPWSRCSLVVSARMPRHGVDMYERADRWSALAVRAAGRRSVTTGRGRTLTCCVSGHARSAHDE
jgi:hypothetical protein